MGEPLRLTDDDISGALAYPVAPPALVIGLEDVPEEAPEPPATGTSAGQRLLISAEDVAAFEPAGPEVVAELEQYMFALVNSVRADELPRWLGRGPLRWHPGAAAVARGHAADMLRRRYVAHTTLEGVTVGQRLDRAGISYLACGENIGVVYGPASQGRGGIEEVHKAFMNQPKRRNNHRANVLNPVWTHVGIGVAYAPEGQLVVAQNFVSTLTNVG
jgi:uncharacterized protein YkwD